jgi:phage baseplate assembly protein W
MPKLSLNGIPRKSDATLDYTYSDLHLDLLFKYNINDDLNNDGEINDLKVDYDFDAIRNGLVNLFTTSPGQKLLEPEFGLDFRKYIFERLTREMATDLRGTIYKQVRRYEPRVTLKDVGIVIYEDDNEMDIDIYFDIPSLNINNATIFGALNKNGFYLRTF